MKETTRSAIIAGLAVLAVALAAATLESTVIPESHSPSGPDGQGGEGSGGVVPLPPSGPASGETVQIPFLSEFLTILTVIVALVTIAYMFMYWRRTLGVVLVVAALFGMSAVLFQFLSSPPHPTGLPVVEPGNGSSFGGGGDAGADTTQPFSPSLILLVMFGLALLGIVVVLFRTTTDDEETARESDDRSTEATAVGRAAGRAADRLEEDTNTKNEVYRTWREMTRLLDVDDPATSTPGEFAAAAVEAGLGREDVSELTRLFEDVRYGEARPSAEHERRAITVFRRIEDRYTEDEW